MRPGLVVTPGNSRLASRGTTTTPSVAARRAPEIFTIVTLPTPSAEPIDWRT